MKNKLAGLASPKIKKEAVSDLLHFIWIGNVKLITIEYIMLWKKTNADKIINLWCDSHISLCGFLHNVIEEYVISLNVRNKSQVEKEIKNNAFYFMYPRLKEGLFFDDLVVEFLSNENIPFSLPDLHTSTPWIEAENYGIAIRDIREIFQLKFESYMKYYYYEIILRGNLASASDIVRLLVIYFYGGVYIDVDTLPYTDNVFHRLNALLKKESLVEHDFIYLYKTECILKKLSIMDFESNDSLLQNKTNTYLDKEILHKIEEAIELDILDFSLEEIFALGRLNVHKNLLAIGAVKRFKGIIFNNVIVSHANSKTVRIILRVMKKRYRFLERNNCIFDFYQNNGDLCYLTRILTWRTELITGDYCVTPVLTGPGLIFEVLVGLAYELLDMEILTGPSEISEYLLNEKFGIAFYQHNLDTPEGMASSWRSRRV